MLTIRAFDRADWPSVWAILEPAFAAGDSYVFATDILEERAYKEWVVNKRAVYVAVSPTKEVLGTYYIKDNQPDLGAHVCNCGYVVAESARGRGLGQALCAHSQDEAARFGYRAMQFNLVVSSNAAAVRAWEKGGFAIVGTLPGAFRHPRLGFVDGYVMFKELDCVAKEKTAKISDAGVCSAT